MIHWGHADQARKLQDVENMSTVSMTMTPFSFSTMMMNLFSTCYIICWCKITRDISINTTFCRLRAVNQPVIHPPKKSKATKSQLVVLRGKCVICSGNPISDSKDVKCLIDFLYRARLLGIFVRAGKWPRRAQHIFTHLRYCFYK